MRGSRLRRLLLLWLLLLLRLRLILGRRRIVVNLELMMMMLLMKIRRNIWRQLLNDDGIPRRHIGDVVVMVGGGVGVRLARRQTAVRRRRGGGAARPRHMQFEAPSGVVVRIAGSEDAALETDATLEVKTEVVDRPCGAEPHESRLGGAPVLGALEEAIFLELTVGGARMRKITGQKIDVVSPGRGRVQRQRRAVTHRLNSTEKSGNLQKADFLDSSPPARSLQTGFVYSNRAI